MPGARGCRNCAAPRSDRSRPTMASCGSWRWSRRPTGAASEMKIDDGRFEPSRLDERLRETIEAVGRAAAAGDASVLEEFVVADARETLVAAYAGANAAAIVACARIGEYRIVKLRLMGRSGGLMLQLQCRPVPDGWRVADARWVGEAPAL